MRMMHEPTKYFEIDRSAHTVFAESFSLISFFIVVVTVAAATAAAASAVTAEQSTWMQPTSELGMICQ